MSEQPRLDFGEGGEARAEAADERARRMAVDPLRSVALEASAGTGKTRVLVDRYVRLIEVGVPPRHILAITFTRKAAAEMRQRVMATLAERRREGALPPARWRELREALPDISILTIDAFCLALLQEFPLEAGVDPGFALADETETPRLLQASLDRALRIGRTLSLTDADVALVLTSLGEAQLGRGLVTLVDRRLVVSRVFARALRGADVTVDAACRRLADALREALEALPGGLAGLVASGPDAPDFALLARALDDLVHGQPPPARVRGALDRLADYVLTQAGTPRQRPAHSKARFRSAADHERHGRLVRALSPRVEAARARYRADLNVALVRGVRRLFTVTLDEYRRTLDDLGALDFPELLDRTLGLLGQMEEFSRSRYRLESRYEHILVDEFQDTSRAQWRLVRELVRAWAAGEGLAHGPIPPTIFIVGDRKQSIYGFRDADVTVLDAAARYIDALRPEAPARAAITRSFRAVGELLAFVNDACAEIDTQPGRPDAFRYGDDDRFPVPADAAREPEALHLVSADTDRDQAEAVAETIARLLVERAVIRDRHTGARRAVGPGDIGILFRTREGHALFEAALARRGVPFYVYKGLGFFDAPEVQDVLALMAYLASPGSDLRAAAWLRSRFVGLSDEALKHLAPNLAASLTSAREPEVLARLTVDDAERLRMARRQAPGWIALADQVPPAELLDGAIAESAYAVEIAGPHLAQSRENLKKVRGMVRRLHNRGYVTLGRLVRHFAELVAGGDESSAIIDAVDAVNLMTVHAAKGLEFPIVFIVNLHRGGGGRRDPIRVVAPPAGDDEAGEEPAGSVAVGEHQDEADRDAEAKDHEETKRLLYVALTRARDRLYLGATRSEGRLTMASGSLGRFLPASLVAAWHGGATAPDVEWQGQSSRHRLRRVPAAGAEATAWRVAARPHDRVDDFAAIPASGAARRAVTDELAERVDRAGSAVLADRPGRGDRESDAETGARVHRLVPWAVAGLGGSDEPAWAIATRLASAPGLRDLLASGHAAFEVPFSCLGPDGAVQRGRIDCVVVSPGAITVVEFKTGAASPDHARQLDLYVAAMAACHPGLDVRGRLVYG